MRMKRHGIALVSLLFMLVAILTLTATLFFSLFLDALASSNVSAGDDALFVAEAGLQHLWAILDPAPDFARELAWPNGEPPFGSLVGFPEAPRTYRVTVGGLADGSLRVRSEGTSHRGTRRRVEAIFVREPRFRPPAALTFAAATSTRDVSGTLEASADETGGELPALGAESPEAAEALRSARGGSSDVALVGSSGLGDAVARLSDFTDVTLDGSQGDGSFGTMAEPVVLRLTGLPEISGTLSVTGIVVADSPLRIFGHLEVHGLLLAPSGVDVEGELTIDGAGWVASDWRLPAAARMTVDYTSAALDAAATAARGALPRTAILGAWREVW